MSTHVFKSCSAVFFWLLNIKRTTKFLARDKLETVCTRSQLEILIDYSSGLLYGLPDREIAKLQRVQKAAARLLTSRRKYNHFTPVLQELHWLPVRYIIYLKFYFEIFKALNGMHQLIQVI